MTDCPIEISMPQTGLAVQAFPPDRNDESRFEAVTCPSLRAVTFYRWCDRHDLPSYLVRPGQLGALVAHRRRKAADCAEVEPSSDSGRGRGTLS
jgi:hypothetical protein